ncbi:MAG: hypothetical protein HFF71_07525 [Oscillospiraceae bacterium]|nr:hypothetical protein [Oscillospiraceae bacterium]
MDLTKKRHKNCAERIMKGAAFEERISVLDPDFLYIPPLHGSIQLSTRYTPVCNGFLPDNQNEKENVV